MTAMPQEQPQMSVDAAILACLGGPRVPQQQELTLPEVVKALQSQGYSESMVKAAVWRLYSFGDVELTEGWKLRAVHQQEDEAAQR